MKARKSYYSRLISEFYHSLLVKPHVPREDGKNKKKMLQIYEVQIYMLNIEKGINLVAHSCNRFFNIFGFIDFSFSSVPTLFGKT
jgi:hypothetical protein